MIPDAVIAHASTGRLRIKIPSQKGNLAALKAHGDQFAACPGVLSVEVNPGTGSILLIHQTTAQEITEYARSKNLFSLVEQLNAAAPSSELYKNLGETFKGFDQEVRKLTSGDMDLTGLVIAALVVVGSAQILSGSARAIPWSAAFWYAYNLYAKRRDGEKK